MAIKQAYLLAYNAFLCSAWAYVLYVTLSTLSSAGTLPALWQAVEEPLKFAQTLAIMEVLHAALGLVRSPVLITATQVASRIWILWGIVNAAPDAITARSVSLLPAGVMPALAHRLSFSLASLLTAWSASEIIRYGFFAFKEAGLQPYFLLWLRYSGFLMLYPLGVASELSMVWLALPALRASNRWNIAMPNSWNFGFTYWVACVVAVAAYLPGFPQLYGYMLAQRRKVLRGGGRVQSKVKPL